MRIAGGVVIVTGASSGIGEATAREMARRGASVVLAARRVDRLERIVTELEASSGRTHLAVETDVASRTDIDRLVRVTVEHFGRVDVLINNAGTGSGGSVLRSEDDAVQHLFDVNLLALVRTVQAAAPHMPRGAVVVNVGSVAGEAPGLGLYAVSKAAVRAFSHGLRPELAAHGIAVVLVEPGFIRTELTARGPSRLPMTGPHVVARAIADAVERPRRTVIVPGWYRVLVWAVRLTPSPLLDWVLRRSARRRAARYASTTRGA